MANNAIVTLKDQLRIEQKELDRVWADKKELIEAAELAHREIDAIKRRVNTLKDAVATLENLEVRDGR